MPQRTLAAIKPTDLPVPPGAAIQVVRACSRPEITHKQLAELIHHDPVLTAEVLRIANSAYFGFRKEVASISHAIGILGYRALRNLVLCTAIRDAVRLDAVSDPDMEKFWEDALRRGVCARSLAQRVGLDAEECFTIALLQDFGLLVMFYLQPQRCGHWPVLAVADPDERLGLEAELFGMTHTQVGRQLAGTWDLPGELGEAIGAHHEDPRDSDGPQAALNRVARCADWMAAVFSAAEKRTVLERCKALLSEHFGIDPQCSHRLLDSSTEGVEAAAAALGFRLGEPPCFDEVMREANTRLAEENLSYQELTWRLQQTLEERDRYATELRKELELAREVQRSLLPGASDRVPGVYGVNVPAKEVSGDFFDYFPLRDGRIYFCLADVSGKGMNAALLMAKTSSLFHCLGKAIHDPGRLLATLNQEIAETTVRGMFVTLVAGIYDPASGRVRLANAGHLPVLQVQSSGEVREYPSNAVPLGILPDGEFPCTEFQLVGASLYLFTDGLIEARTGRGARLEMTGLLELITRHAHLPAGERVRCLVEAVSPGDGMADDDRTLLLIEHTG